MVVARPDDRGVGQGGHLVPSVGVEVVVVARVKVLPIALAITAARSRRGDCFT